MTIYETIQKAIKGGYKKEFGYLGPSLERDYFEIFLDPLFWLSLGKALEWEDEKFYQFEPSHSFMGEKMPEAKWYFRSFMNHIWEGKSAEEFFKSLK